ncbi:MAG TPA: ferritin-like domain-containing protein [Burkholderiales bacterium]|nr:ferritin-like domain-containing protein [Burkholderiales bacterium]
MTQSAGFHEDVEKLKPETRDRHRAIVSIMEELEAVDWYDQRVDAAGDDELRGILAHNRDEEKEHAAMVLEWLRRRDSHLDQQLREYLFTDKPVLEREEELDESASVTPKEGSCDGSLGIGSLRATVNR